MPNVRRPAAFSRPTVMIIAGEASGDAHGAKLVRAIARKDPRIGFAGIGGERMAAAGVELVFDASDLSVVGLTEVLSRAGSILRGISSAKRLLRRRPDLLILVDYPEFNLHIAAYAKKLGIPVLFYISPQIWAWRSGRVHKIGRRIDHMAVILPFEEAFYRRHGIPATFVGHPLMDGGRSSGKETVDPAAYAARLGGAPEIALLPGSRDGEIERLLPVMLGAADILSRRHPGARFLLSRSASVAPERLSDIAAAHGRHLPFEVVSTGLGEIYRRAALVIAASGTVTLETALAGIPMIVVYRVSPISYRLGKALIRVDHISLVNLIAGRRLVPELVQDDASAEKIADTAAGLLSDTDGLLAMQRALTTLAGRLGRSGASERTAEIALGLLDARRRRADG